ncbi:MAG: hypothetical protein H0V70_10485 [Ktedonobacteraceae bacterium]|nr:hypothetical protein [Ktedonobacteraceae bacterium]
MLDEPFVQAGQHLQEPVALDPFQLGFLGAAYADEQTVASVHDRKGYAQKHEEFEVSVCKIAIRHRKQVGTDCHNCSPVPKSLIKGGLVY